MSVTSATIIFAATMLTATGLQAQTVPSPNPPQKTVQQQQRVHEANQRIDEEYRKGAFTREEAQALKLDERDVRQQTR